MSMGSIVMATLLVVVGIVVTVGIYLLIGSGTSRDNKYQKQGKRILVQDGIDVKKQILGSDKGAYFTGNLEKRGTSLVNPQENLFWNICFRNIDTGQNWKFRFCGHIQIGRDQTQMEEEALVVENDPMVSKVHCIIYDVEGRLCLNDMQSKNHTYLDGVRVESPVYLEDGCILKVGNTRFEVRCER